MNPYSQGKMQKGKKNKEEEVKEKGTNKRQKVVSYEELNVLRGLNYLKNAHELYAWFLSASLRKYVQGMTNVLRRLHITFYCNELFPRSVTYCSLKLFHMKEFSNVVGMNLAFCNEGVRFRVPDCWFFVYVRNIMGIFFISNGHKTQKRIERYEQEDMGIFGKFGDIWRLLSAFFVENIGT